MSGQRTVFSAGLALLVAAVSFLSVSGNQEGSIPQSLHLLPSHIFGPLSTKANDGYEPPDKISPVVPPSYVALRFPERIGIQFTGDNPKDLARDHFLLGILGVQPGPQALYPTVGLNGFVGSRLSSSPDQGTYDVAFSAPQFSVPVQRWVIRYRPQLGGSGPEGPLLGIGRGMLNVVRGNLFEKGVQWNENLALAAESHARYLQINGYDAPSFHREQASKPWFTGINPWERDLSFGWPSALVGEVGIEWSHPLPVETVIQDLLDTVYHRLSLLSPNLMFEGGGSSAGLTGAIVMDLGYGYQPRLPQAVAYPAPGQTGVPTSWYDLESPDPVRNGYGNTYGYPITIDWPTVVNLTGVRARLSKGGQSIPIFLDANQVNLEHHQLALIPKVPLAPDSLYWVTVQATARYYSGKVRKIRLRWQFATGGSNLSVMADPLSRHRLLVSVVESGSGIPMAGEPVTLFRQTRGTHLTYVTHGQTNRQGLLVMTLNPGIRGHKFVVAAQSGNLEALTL